MKKTKKFAGITCHGCKSFIHEPRMSEGDWRYRECKKGHTDNARRPLPLRCEDFTTTSWHYFWHSTEKRNNQEV